MNPMWHIIPFYSSNKVGNMYLYYIHPDMMLCDVNGVAGGLTVKIYKMKFCYHFTDVTTGVNLVLIQLRNA